MGTPERQWHHLLIADSDQMRLDRVAASAGKAFPGMVPLRARTVEEARTHFPWPIGL